MQPTIFKSTMSNGIIMGGLFSVNFLFSVSKSTFLGLLSYGIVALILVIMYRTANKYRDQECEGYITYGKALRFIVLTFFFGAIISSIVKFIYFQYINPEYLAYLTNETLKLMDSFNLLVSDDSVEQMEKMLKPASYSLQFIWFNTLMGLIVGLIMSIFVKKEKSIFE